MLIYEYKHVYNNVDIWIQTCVLTIKQQCWYMNTNMCTNNLLIKILFVDNEYIMCKQLNNNVDIWIQTCVLTIKQQCWYMNTNMCTNN